MNVQSLALQHIRTYEKQLFTFVPGVTVIIGPNAIGKTNILEAISLCSTGKSFRATKDVDVIAWGHDVAHIQLIVISNGMEQGTDDHIQPATTKLEITLTQGQVNGKKTNVKTYKVNAVPRRQIDFVGFLRSVLFTPSDLELVTDSPSIRRTYLNTVLTQVDREYRRNLYSYERGLRQRNSLLERIHDGFASRSQLLFWDQLLIKTGIYIQEKREAFIREINTFSLHGLRYHILSDPSPISVDRLNQYKEEEIAAKMTLVGPQRDDMHFEKYQDRGPEKDDIYIDVSRFGSRGEQRLAVLWLKLAELEFIEKNTGERPVLLLDDIFSELDETGKTIVSSIVNKQQTIITSADEESVEQFKTIADTQVMYLPIWKKKT